MKLLTYLLIYLLTGVHQINTTTVATLENRSSVSVIGQTVSHMILQCTSRTIHVTRINHTVRWFITTHRNLANVTHRLLNTKICNTVLWKLTLNHTHSSPFISCTSSSSCHRMVKMWLWLAGIPLLTSDLIYWTLGQQLLFRSLWKTSDRITLELIHSNCFINILTDTHSRCSNNVECQMCHQTYLRL